MTQDPYRQPPGTGYVVPGEVVPDDEANVTPPTAPMTHFQKVASALGGDRTDPAMPAYVSSDQGASPESPDPGANQAGQSSRDAQDAPQDAQGASRDAQDAPQDAQGASRDAQGASRDAQDDADRDATRPEEIIAVRSPDAGSRDYWDDADQTGPHEVAQAAASDGPAADTRADTAAQDPTTQPNLYGAAASTATDTAHAEAAEVGAVEPEVVGKHAGAPAQEGLRPGESDHGLGDFSDLTYGSLLPDAAEFKARWHQVQFRFVDDPQGSVTEAADVIAQVATKLEAAIAERQRAIAERQRALRGRWSDGKSADTESLRETLLMYRAFLDQLTGPKDG